ncbi:hypothetical protein I3843_16G013600 [Carya illinoinensis]|nr:hypothetical protein I3843_16G013600 [Carya illinoinensis]
MFLMRELVIESKRIAFVREGVNFRLSERGWKEKYEVVVCRNTLLWLASVLGDCLRGGSKAVYSVVREGYRSFVAQRCINHRGRYLSVAEYGREGRVSLLCFPEGSAGRGWKSLKEMAEEMTQLREPVVKVDGNKAYRNSNCNYAETFMAARPVHGETSGGGGGAFRATQAVRGSGHGGPKVGQETWVSSRRLLDLQGQLRKVQREMEELRDYVGMKKDFKGKGKLVLAEGEVELGPCDQGPKGPKCGPQPCSALLDLEWPGPAENARPSVSFKDRDSGPGPGPTQPTCVLSPVGSPGDPVTIHASSTTPEIVLCSPATDLPTVTLQKVPTGEGGDSGRVPVAMGAQYPRPILSVSSPATGEFVFPLCGGQMKPDNAGVNGVDGMELSILPESDSEGEELEGERVSEVPNDGGYMGLEDFTLDGEFQGNQINRMEEPTPLNFCLPYQPNVSDWVFHKVKEIQKIVGLECDGYEEQFMALFTAIEEGHKQKNKGDSKKHRELKRLSWSMNVEGSASRSRVKGKGQTVPP